MHDDSIAMVTTSAIAAWSGVALIAVARRLQFPAIVALLVGGVALGPAGLGVVQPDSLGRALRVVVALAIGLVLFEGGLTLDLSGFRTAPRMIWRLLTIGVLVTLLGGTLAIHLLAQLPVDQAFITASLVVVTGPTVITPLLKRLRLGKKLHSVLQWEGVLIDPIGVFIALLSFEWLGEAGGTSAFVSLGLRVLAGLGLGIPGGLILAWLLKHRLIDDEIRNVFILASALLLYGGAELVRSEAGLLSVTIAGFVVGLRGRGELKELRAFKAEIADLLIGALFILLSARLEVAQFARFGVGGVLAVVAIMLVVRPISIALCSIGLDFDWKEKVFLSWVAPRGIVAASMASLVAIRLQELGFAMRPRFAETFTYSVIFSTVVLQGLTARPLAARLGLSRGHPNGWVLVGTHAFARRLAQVIGARTTDPVVLVDTNEPSVELARNEGLDAVLHDARDTSLLAQRPGVGHLLALTTNDDLNARVCYRWGEHLGYDQVFRPDLGLGAGEKVAGVVVWKGIPDPLTLSTELARGNATLCAGDATPHRESHVLGEWQGAHLQLGSTARGGGGRATALLQLELRNAHLLGAIHPHLIRRIDETDPARVYADLMAHMAQLHPSLDRQAALDELLAREREVPSMLGGGIVAPHVYHASAPARMCAIAQVPPGLALTPPDGQPIRLVFLLVSPEGDAEGHLATLGEIARLVTPHELRQRLLHARTATDVLELVRGALQGAGG